MVLKKSKDSINDYLKLIKLAKSENINEIKFGLEVCYTSKKEIRRFLETRFDFLVGAVHSVYGCYDMENFQRITVERL